MPDDIREMENLFIDVARLSAGEREELKILGVLSDDDRILPYATPAFCRGRPIIEKRAVHAGDALNEAYDYFPRPSAFSRGLALEIHGTRILLLSGTPSVNQKGKTAHVGDFRAQCWRTYRNLTALLRAERMTWHDVVRTTCYLRDIERDSEDFNEIRTAFFHWLGLDPLPVSTGVQARLSRDDLLVEIELTALAPSEDGGNP